MIEIYRKLRPGDPPTLETATNLFRGMFFDPRKYDFSRFDHAENNFGNHDKGYFGWGDEPEGEEDSEDSMVSLHIEYESGRSISIDTRKPSEIEGLMPLIEELIRYHDTLF